MLIVTHSALAPAKGWREQLFYAALLLFLLPALAGCSGSGDGSINLVSDATASEEPPPVEEPQPPVNEQPQLRPASSASEYVGVEVGVPMEEEQVLSVLSQLLGAEAASGAHLMNFELQPGLMLSSTDDSRSSEQQILQVDMRVSNEDVTPAQRTLFRGPASYAYGAIFVDVVAAALQELRNNAYRSGGETAQRF